MGGQACVLYGAAEFSRDTDIVILSDASNMEALRNALADLQAERIAVPPFDLDYLRRGHAIHFRCRNPEAEDCRLDIMAVMRGVAPFPDLWERRTTIEVAGSESYELLSLPDLVIAKKTQRDKDWPMIRQLVETHYGQNSASPTREIVRFWLRELRTASLLRQVADAYPDEAQTAAGDRKAVAAAVAGVMDSDVETQLRDEERRDRDIDRAYWAPLRAELEAMRRARI